MRHRSLQQPFLLLACALALACTPMAGTHPIGSASPAPAGVVSLARPLQVRGVAEVAGAAFGGAALTAFDLASGQALSLEGTARTDASGRFEFRLPFGSMQRLVKVVASVMWFNPSSGGEVGLKAGLRWPSGGFARRDLSIEVVPGALLS
ncbi:MAG: hypothetical protein VKP62_01230 [Candidatus Sericytochromatia bacterium]|nr:hypothetical protein [Candidatus Sericytochromatia bacterium]